MPQYATLSTAECNAIHIAREYAPDQARKAMKREIFARAKVAFAIPASHKLVVETDVQNSNAGVLKNKATRETYALDDNGKWVGANGTNAADAQRWFKLPLKELFHTTVDALDSMDANDDDIEVSVAAPAGTPHEVNGDKIIIGVTGDVWVLLDADAYEPHAHDEEEDDDQPY